jgi:hypothetical protein
MPKENGQLTDKVLREFLLFTLPEYMILAAPNFRNDASQYSLIVRA